MADQESLPSCRRCCSLPHGTPLITASILSTFAVIFSFVMMGSCHFASQSNLERDIGLFGYEESYGSCVNYQTFWSDNTLWTLIDPAWRTARIFSIVSTCIGFVAFVVSWCGSCVAFRRRYFVGLCITFVICSLLSFFTLLFFASGVCRFNGGSCSFGIAAGIGILTGVIYAIAAISCWVAPEAKAAPTLGTGTIEIPVVAASNQGGSLAVTVTETVTPDGVKTTKKVTTMADGSKLVEQTVETPFQSDERIAFESTSCP